MSFNKKRKDIMNVGIKTKKFSNKKEFNKKILKKSLIICWRNKNNKKNNK